MASKENKDKVIKLKDGTVFITTDYIDILRTNLVPTAFVIKQIVKDETGQLKIGDKICIEKDSILYSTF